MIRTVNGVLREGATLVQESGPLRRALSLGTGYRNLTPESGQGRRLTMGRRGASIPARLSRAATSRVRVRGEWT